MSFSLSPKRHKEWTRTRKMDRASQDSREEMGSKVVCLLVVDVQYQLKVFSAGGTGANRPGNLGKVG